MRKFGWCGAVILMLLTGCGGGESAVTVVDGGVDSLGAELFRERVIGAVPGCVTCHSLDEGVTLVGPSLFGLAQRAAARVPGLSAVEYVRQSIMDPEAFIVPDFSAGQMIGNWAELLSADQMDSLIDYLLTSSCLAQRMGRASSVPTPSSPSTSRSPFNSPSLAIS